MVFVCDLPKADPKSLKAEPPLFGSATAIGLQSPAASCSVSPSVCPSIFLLRTANPFLRFLQGGRMDFTSYKEKIASPSDRGRSPKGFPDHVLAYVALSFLVLTQKAAVKAITMSQELCSASFQGAWVSRHQADSSVCIFPSLHCIFDCCSEALLCTGQLMEDSPQL